MRSSLAAVIAVALVLPGVAAAAVPVNVQFAAFSPDQLDVLPAETVVWTNASERTHTVTADDGSFASSDLLSGNTFSHAFDQAGSYAYHCTIHTTMTGHVDVREVTLEALPTAPVPTGSTVEFAGRTSDPQAPVRIELAHGSDFAVIASAAPKPDGTWSASVPAKQTGAYRAASDRGPSETRRLLVSNQRVMLHATKRGITVTVTPSRPYAHVVLERDLRDRFGWWPVARAQLDYISQATFHVMRPARIRVALVGADQWTPVATSAVLTLGHPRHAPKAPAVPMHHEQRSGR